MNFKIVLIAFCLFLQFGVLNYAYANCQTAGATQVNIQGNVYCTVAARYLAPDCLVFNQRAEIMDNNGAISITSTPACSIDEGICSSKLFNGNNTTMRANVKTNHCNFDGVSQAQCTSPYFWDNKGCSTNPPVTPTCPAGSIRSNGNVARWGCYAPTYKCDKGTMMLTLQKTPYCVVP
jgi:hypothetical protein